MRRFDINRTPWRCFDTALVLSLLMWKKWRISCCLFTLMSSWTCSLGFSVFVRLRFFLCSLVLLFCIISTEYCVVNVYISLPEWLYNLQTAVGSDAETLQKHTHTHTTWDNIWKLIYSLTSNQSICWFHIPIMCCKYLHLTPTFYVLCSPRMRYIYRKDIW